MWTASRRVGSRWSLGLAGIFAGWEDRKRTNSKASLLFCEYCQITKLEPPTNVIPGAGQIPSWSAQEGFLMRPVVPSHGPPKCTLAPLATKRFARDALPSDSG